MAFVLLAFAFLFKYAFDQGWIGPAFRLVLGLVASTAMLIIGLRLEGSRERYSLYLLGGAIGVYYLVGFASYELYQLVPFVAAFAFMCGVTVLAFVLAERQRLASLAVIGAGGGLATPFLIDNGAGNVPGLVLYTTLLLAGAGAVQFLRGWRALLFLLGFGGLAVMALAVEGLSDGPSAPERAIVTLGILSAWALFGAFPLLRAHLGRLEPDAWPDPPLTPWWDKVVGSDRISRVLLRVACVSASIVGLLEVGAVFTLQADGLGLLFAAGAVVYLALSVALAATRPALDVAAETASILLGGAIALFLADYRVMLPIAVLSTGMLLAHDRWRLPGVAVLAHVFFAELLFILVGHLDLSRMAVVPFGPRELGALGAILLALASSLVVEAPGAKRAYRTAIHVAFLVWLATQFGPLRYGQELISLSWGIYGIVLLLVALRLGNKGIQLAGLVTLGVVAAKLLLVDMAQVDVVWRILLFMGFGASFLGLSYLINREAGES